MEQTKRSDAILFKPLCAKAVLTYRKVALIIEALAPEHSIKTNQPASTTSTGL